VVKLTLVANLQAWVEARRAMLESNGIEIRSDLSPPDRPDPSYALNLRKGAREADLVVWNSGQADLITSQNVDAKPTMDHLTDLLEPRRLETILERVLEVFHLQSN